MQHKVIITTQYRENYGAHDWDGTGDCPQGWKMKGAHLFSLMMYVNDLMYDKERCLKVIKSMLAKESNNYESFEYVEHEVQWSSPTELSSDVFKEMIKSERETNHTIAGVDFSENIEQLNKLK